MSETACAVDIDGMVNTLLDRLDNTDTDAQLIEGLCVQAPLIREIATACEQTSLFRRATDKYAAFKADLEADFAAEDRLLESWLHFLQSVINAPTTLHRLGAVRICLPLVAAYLPEVA